jgi:hypothetical protein
MTSRFIATTLIDLYRDNTGQLITGGFDGYDDHPAESATPLHTRLPAHLTLRTKNVYDPVSGRGTLIESWFGLLRPGADVQESDRLHDLKTGNRFTVDSVNMVPLVVGAADVRLTLTRIAR